MLPAKLVFIERDLAPFFIPPKIVWTSLVKSGQVPLWNPYNFSGMPLLATLQPGICYPPNVLYFILPFNVAWNWLVILHFIFAGIAIYLLSRHLKASHTGSFIAGVVFMLSGYLLSVHNLLTHLYAVSWFPLVVLYSIKAVETNRKRYAAAAAISLSMEFLAGAPEIFMLTVPVLIAFAVFWRKMSEKNLSYAATFRNLSFIFSICLLLISVQLLPFVELKMHSIRNAGLDYAQAVTWSLAYKDFLQFFLPDVFGYAKTSQSYWANQSWLKTIYLGMAPFIFSLFFLMCKDSRRWFFLALMGVSLIFALGGNTPVYKLAYHVPPFNSIRYPVKFLFLFFFVISIMSGLGFDRFRHGVEEGDEKTRVLTQVLFYFGLFLAVLWGFLNINEAFVTDLAERYGLKPDRYNDIWFNLHNAKRFLLFSCLFCVALIFYLRRKPKRMIALCIVGLVTADLFLANFGFYQKLPWKVFMTPGGFADLLDNQGTQRYFVTPQTERDYEHAIRGRLIMSASYAGMLGFYSAGGSEVMRVGDYDRFQNAHYCGRTLIDARRFFDISGVRFVITSYEVVHKDFNLIKSIDFGDKKAYLYEYADYQGRFFIYGRYRFAWNDKEIVETLRNDAIDLRRELILTGNKEIEARAAGPVKGTVRLVSYKANTVMLESDSDKNAFLYLSDAYYPGWRAYVDGERTEIYRANLAFRAVRVPAGRHVVVFKYVPMSFYIGLFLTLAGIALCVWLYRRDRKMTSMPGLSPDGAGQKEIDDER